MCNHQRVGFLPTAIILVLLSCATAAAQTGKLQLYFFTNPGCGPCRQVEPELEQLHREGFSVMKINTSMHPDWTRRFRVTKTPTVVLCSGNTVVASHSGFIDAGTMRGWFQSANSNLRQTQPSSQAKAASNKSSTIHKGTIQPKNELEELAMQATVRLKIDDPEGTSYATGTIIHAFENEALVLTCGHVFRDSDGKGEISAEYGFLENQIRNTVGELIFYDADARDIGLVAIKTDGSVKPVSVAAANQPITASQSIFSIGCDHGERPTIRRSEIIRQAKYDGVKKTEIVGRPVNGRSGGGLFTADGKLIGVCNAAVVDVDEGVYVALDTIHWQFEQARLAHLFSPGKATRQVASNDRAFVKADMQVRLARNFNDIPVRSPLSKTPPAAKVASSQRSNEIRTNPVSLSSDAETELIIVMRRKSDQSSESWTVANPTPDLVQALRGMGDPDSKATSGSDRLARLRGNMPKLQQATGKNYNVSQMRAQSPR